MIYWLIMYIFAGTSSYMLHFGNYRSMESAPYLPTAFGMHLFTWLVR